MLRHMYLPQNAGASRRIVGASPSRGALAAMVGAASPVMLPAGSMMPVGAGCAAPAVSAQAYADACALREASARNAQIQILRANSAQQPLGINNRDAPNAGTIIAANETRTLTASPSVPICLTKFVVDRGSSPFFQITSIRNALREFLTDGQSIPADNFSPDGSPPPMKLPILMPGTSISVTVRNKTSESHDFYAQFYGLVDWSLTDASCL